MPNFVGPVLAVAWNLGGGEGVVWMPLFISVSILKVDSGLRGPVPISIVWRVEIGVLVIQNVDPRLLPEGPETIWTPGEIA